MSFDMLAFFLYIFRFMAYITIIGMYTLPTTFYKLSFDIIISDSK